MAALFRGTFDDSGDQDDPQHNCMSLAGYIGPFDSWERFEIRWKRVLEEFEVPYLHMREFKKPDGLYSHLLNCRARMAEFFAALAAVIADCSLFGFCSVVRIQDLKKFNKEFDVEIDGYSLAIADCLGNISLSFPGVLMDVRVDRGPSKPRKKINLALEYMASEKRHRECFQNVEDYIDIAPFPKGLTFRNVQSIQAADFAAWELRKSILAKDEFFTKIKPGLPQDDWFMHYLIWLAERDGTATVPPGGERKSFAALKQDSPIEGGVWDYHALCCQHEVRGGIWSAP